VAPGAAEMLQVAVLGSSVRLLSLACVEILFLWKDRLMSGLVWHNSGVLNCMLFCTCCVEVRPVGRVQMLGAQALLLVGAGGPLRHRLF
jgi:hypothetical protein